MNIELHDGPKLAYPGGDRGRLLELLAVFFLFCAPNIFLLAAGYTASGSDTTVGYLVADMLMRVGLCALVPLLLTRREVFDWKLPRTGRDWGKEFGWGLLLIAEIILCNVLIGLLVNDFGLDDSTQWSEPMQDRTVVAALLMFTPIIGVHEELLFRVYAQTRLTQVLRGKRFLPVFIASGVFAAMHGYALAGTLMILAFGLILGASYQANGKIPRLVIAHTLWNIGVLVLALR
jgi:membrane protease YdiL (CAAX protease family)